MSDHTSDLPLTKVCTKCKAELLATPEFFSRDKHNKDGLKSECTACRNERNALYRLANPEKEHKRAARYRRANPDKQRERMARWRAKNPDQAREKDVLWRTKNPDKVREKSARWRAANPDKVRAGDARRRKANPEKTRLVNQHRRARKRAAEGHFTVADIETQCKRQKGKCYYCGKKRKLTIEHLVPLVRGGSNNPDNIVMACGPCNNSKGRKLPHEFTKGGRLL